MIHWLDLSVVLVFAVSGALAADLHGMDLFGFGVVALLTAIGGGTLRDTRISGRRIPALWIILLAAFMTFFAANAIQRVEGC